MIQDSISEDVPSLETFEKVASKHKELLLDCFSKKDVLSKLKFEPLMDLKEGKMDLVKDLILKKDLNHKELKTLENTLAEVNGTLSKFYFENPIIKNTNFETLHGQIMIYGDTNSGKDCTLTNLLQMDIGIIGKGITTKFPERIQLKCVGNEPNFNFYQEKDFKTMKNFKSLADLNKERKNSHKKFTKYKL